MAFLKKILVRAALSLEVWLVAALLGAGACTFFVYEKFSEENSGGKTCKTFADAFPLRFGEKTVFVRLALTEVERQRGLTGCRGLAENAGMLFVYADESQRGFWMRGVPIGLSIGFFDKNGVLLETHEMNANELSVTESRSGRVKFVLEMPSGWFEQNAVAAGTSFSLNELAGAMRERGFLPENFKISPEN